ncbi:MAG: PLP-dependent transferase [Thermoleophilia bacterium]
MAARRQEGVEQVRRPGLPDSPYAPLVARYLPRRAGRPLLVRPRRRAQAGTRFIEALDVFSHLANAIGDARSLVIHPASTTHHRQLADGELAAAGIGPGTIRLSIGLEDVDDLLWGLGRGLEAARA